MTPLADENIPDEVLARAGDGKRPHVVRKDQRGIAVGQGGEHFYEELALELSLSAALCRPHAYFELTLPVTHKGLEDFEI